jgi:hypothetical protein
VRAISKIKNPPSLKQRRAELSDKDSNLERQNQNLQCYHYTIGQSPLILKGSTKVIQLALKCHSECD